MNWPALSLLSENLRSTTNIGFVPLLFRLDPNKSQNGINRKAALAHDERPTPAALPPASPSPVRGITERWTNYCYISMDCAVNNTIIHA